MSRYAYRGAAPRWPWALVALALGLAVVVILARAGRIDIPRLTPHDEPSAALGSQPPAAPAAASPANESASSAAPQAASSAAPTAVANDAAASVVATPVVPEKSPEELAAAWVDFWNKGDYGAMYDLLSAAARRSIARDAFIERYQAIADRSGLTGLHAAVAGNLTPGRQMPIAVDYDSKLVGRFTEQNAIPFTRDNGAWRVAWTPSLIFSGLGTDGCVDVDVQPVRRGTIFDRNGEPLAYDGTVERVGVVPDQIPASDHDRVLKALSDLTGSPVDTLEKEIAAADPTWFVQIKDFPASRGQELLNIISGLPGVSVHSATARVYPLGAQAAHVTGYVSPATAEELAANPDLAPGQLIGQAGVEAGADDLLSGKPGVRLIVVGCESRVERATIAARPAVPSSDITLTIDRGLQVAADAALRAQGNVKGSAVVLDPRDGAVLAMASLPTYDPNGFILGFNATDRAQLNSDTLRPLLNRAAQAAYPTGSIFKVITFSAAIEDLHDTPETVIDCPSTFQLAGSSQVWQDWTVAEGLGPQGPMTLHKALVNSCNTVFYQIGRDLDETDPELLPKMAKAFGLGAPTGIPYLPEVGGVVPDPTWKQQTMGDYWATGDAINLAIGQGFLEATPLQMAVAYAAIANGGDLLQPYIVSTIIHADNQRQPVGGKTVRSRLPLAPTTISALQDALRDQTSDWNGAGSVRVFGDFPWPIAGKTGTAQNELDRSQKPHSWFAAFGPYGQEATIASVVMFENMGEGVSFAAPATRQIYEAYLQSDLASRQPDTPAAGDTPPAG